MFSRFDTMWDCDGHVLLCPYCYLEDIMVKLEELKIQLF